RVLALAPGLAVAHSNLGNALKALGRRVEAEASYRRALAIQPDFLDAWYNLGNTLRDAGRIEEAIDAFRQALVRNPRHPAVLNNLAVCELAVDALDAAIEHLDTALELAPEFADAHNNLGNALRRKDDDVGAEASYRKAIAVDPRHADAHWNLGCLLNARGVSQEVATLFRRVVELDPRHAAAWYNLGSVETDLGRREAGLAAYRQAIACDHERLPQHGNYLYALQSDPRQTAQTILDAHRAWADVFEPVWTSHRRPFDDVDRDPERPLTVGLVSADLGRHPVGFFLAGVLPHLDRERLRIVAWSSRGKPDEYTERLRAACDVWHDVADLDHAQLAERIRADRVDVLLDLSGHTDGNRLPVFAMRAAPVQATWAGYVGTTGLSTMDWLIADRWHVPPGSEALYTERIMRLPNDYICYQAPDYAPPVAPPPEEQEGRITFGSFNNLIKINPEVAALWTRVLDAVPGSRLLIKYAGGDNPDRQAWLRRLFEDAGLAPERLILEGKAPHAELLAAYARVDVALDTFPYAGGLTTLEALWMGVPVITRGDGDRFCARHSVSHLTNAGFPELIAPNADAFVELATALARDRERRTELRNTLRERMAASPLCDGAAFARDLEAAWREMWRNWCEARP
ncbi:MAG: tetratricopeptide repeat protein, partial [Chromatiales bacterium]|nr:tetratricopeptide repeat protein [Chromatiales bacterium]